MLQSLKKILRADSEKFYEVEKITPTDTWT